MSSVLEAIKLNKGFTKTGGPEVLSNVSFAIKAKESVAITGSSGCGKSTLLHVIAGLAKPDTGHVEVGGVDITKLSRSALGKQLNKHIGFVYQFHHLLAEFSAVENVAIPLLIAGIKRKQAMEKANLLLEEVGLQDRALMEPGKLSGGERQRIAVVRALANSPSLVIADEPTGNLDRKNASAVTKLLLDECSKRECALLVATHDQDLANNFAKNYLLVDGNLT